MGYTLIESDGEAPVKKGRYRIVEEADDNTKANGSTLHFGPLDTGIPLSDSAFQFLAGAGKRLSDIATLGSRDTSLDKPLMDKGWAQAGSAGADLATMLGGGALLRGAGAAVAGSVPRIGNALQIAGRSLVAPSSITEGAAAAGLYGAATTPGDIGDRLINGAAGAAGAGIAQGATNALARVVSPKASTNANLALLKEEGVTPTIGQSLGGRWNALEEKLQSLPIVGDMIANRRGDVLKQFNEAAINRASGKVGEKVSGVGQAAIREAGDAISKEYDDALNAVHHVTFDQNFGQSLNQLRSMASNLVPGMAQKFDKTLDDIVLSRMSPNGSMLGETYKSVDSELGRLASRYGKSTVASEQELGDALAQMQALLKDQMMRSNPAVAERLSAADAGWANLVRLEQAAKSAKNAEGVFTPAQLNSAIQQADGSVRGRAVARGNALMQDLGNAGQQVIGNKVPNSFTTDRALIAGGALGSYLVNPAIPAALVAGGAAYSAPVQNALRFLFTERPQVAQTAAEGMRKAAPYLNALGASAALPVSR